MIVFKNNNQTLYDYSRKNQFKHSFIKISLKFNIYKEYIAKFQINDSFENFTHEVTIFAHYFE